MRTLSSDSAASETCDLLALRALVQLVYAVALAAELRQRRDTADKLRQAALDRRRPARKAAHRPAGNDRAPRLPQLSGSRK